MRRFSGSLTTWGSPTETAVQRRLSCALIRNIGTGKKKTTIGSKNIYEFKRDQTSSGASLPQKL